MTEQTTEQLAEQVEEQTKDIRFRLDVDTYAEFVKIAKSYNRLTGPFAKDVVLQFIKQHRNGQVMPERANAIANTFGNNTVGQVYGRKS